MFRSDGKFFLFAALILFFLPILLVKVNFLKTTEVYSGLFRDGSNGAVIDLVEVKVGKQVTYSDREGKYFMKRESSPILGFFVGKNPFDPNSGRGQNFREIEIKPTFQFEDPSPKISCSLLEANWLSRRFDCSHDFYPQVFEMASRVMAGEAIGGLQKEYEIRARKSQLWDLLSLESQKLWASREEFAGFLTLKEMTQVALNEQPVSFEVSRQPVFINSYSYLGKTNLIGDLAKVEISVMDAQGRPSKRLLYFKRSGGIWKSLYEQTPKLVSEYTSRNSRVLKK